MQITELIKLHFKCHLSDFKYAWMNFRTINLKLTCFSWNSLMRFFLICNRLIFITTTFFAVKKEELSSVSFTFQKWSSRHCLSSSVLSTSNSLEICVSETLSQTMFVDLAKQHLAASHVQMLDFAHNEYMFHQYMCSDSSGILLLLGEVEKLVTWFLHLFEKKKKLTQNLYPLTCCSHFHLLLQLFPQITH